MTDKFDPYYKWLGIPPRDQPPHHYRLLGIELFESDRDVIDAAANRVMAYLKDLAAGDEAEYSQSLLNEVSRARICLLNKEKKTAYDKDLRADLKSKGIPEPKAGKPSARPPAKRRKEAPEEDTALPQPPADEPWPNIRTDAPRSKAKADPVVFAEPDESDESDDERPAGTGRWKLVAATATVAALVIAGLIVAAVFLFLGSGDDQVASGQNGELQGGSDSSTTDGEGEGQEGKPANYPDSDPESDPEMDPEADPEADPETDPSATSKAKSRPPSDADDSDSPGNKTKPKANPDDSPDPKADPKLPDWSHGEDPDNGSSTSKPSPDVNSDDGSAKPKDEPTDVTSDPKDGKPSPDDTMVAKVDVPDVDPAKEPVDPEPPVKPMPLPFQDLPLTVTLPDLEAADAMTPQVLGPVHCQPDDLCFIKLRGGKGASKGSQEFIMRNAEFGSAERDWEVLSREGQSEPETKVAHLSINDQSQLAFQWQPQAKTVPLTANLCNCAFSLNCNGKSHVVALRQAGQVEGMALELDKPSTDEHWKIEIVPDPNAVKIEIVGVQGAEYAVQLTPVVEADKGETWIDLKDGGDLLSLQVETRMKRNVEVTITPHLKTPPDGRPQKFNAAVFAKLLSKGKMDLARLQIGIQQMQQAVGPATGPLKRQLEQNLVQAQELQVQQQAALDNGLKLEEFLKDADGNLQLQLRVFCDADSTEIDLLHIGGRATPSEGTTPP